MKLNYLLGKLVVELSWKQILWILVPYLHSQAILFLDSTKLMQANKLWVRIAPWTLLWLRTAQVKVSRVRRLLQSDNSRYMAVPVVLPRMWFRRDLATAQQLFGCRASDNALNLRLVCLNDAYSERVHGTSIHQVWGKNIFCSFPVCLKSSFFFTGTWSLASVQNDATECLFL